MTWLQIYDLKQDANAIEGVQKATLTTKEFGLEPTHGLFGSAEWWRQVEDGSLPVHTHSGEIVRVYMASMNDWPMFEMRTEDGSLHQFTQQLHRSESFHDEPYLVGRKVEVDFVWQHARKNAPDWGLPNESQVVIGIRIEM